MFHRRLLLLLVVFSCATFALGAQLFRLTVLQGPVHRREAESVLSSRKLVETVRGSIVDRKGRVLAEDAPCYDIAVEYEVITGQWAYDEARRVAYRDHVDSWAKMSFEEREALIEQYRKPFDEQLDRLWSLMLQYGHLNAEQLAERKATIIKRVQTIRADVWDRRAKRRAAERGGPVELDEVAIKIAEEVSEHTILPAVAGEVAYPFRKLQDELPGLKVIESKTRRYPYRQLPVELSRASLPTPLRDESAVKLTVDNVGAHLIGSMRDAWAEDEARRPFRRSDQSPDLGGYLPGDRVGLGGVEAAEEDRLRGLRGQVLRRKDTGAETRHAPVWGKDVELTVDIALQARIRAIMTPAFGLMQVQDWHNNEDAPVGTELFGAAVVLDVDSGHVLSMVSTPAPPARIEGKPYPDLGEDPDRPLMNKPIASVYPPGSTVKPLVYCMATATKNIGWDQAVDCQGHLLESKPNAYRCWGWRPDQGKYGRHGPVGPAEAIARSCNIYFYTCGRNMGPRTIVEQFQRWGFGQPIGLGLPEEVSGMMPNLDEANVAGRELSLPNAIMMGIGQGPIAVPPIQVAAAHAALARGGYYFNPLLIRHRAGVQDGHELNIAPPVVSHALDGMRQSANELHGTAHHLNLPSGREPILNLEDVIVRAKTGTAQAPKRFDGRTGEHSWFVCHVQKPGDQRASYIVVVMVEYGGSGGRVSGPVANQIIHALRSEGYL